MPIVLLLNILSSLAENGQQFEATILTRCVALLISRLIVPFVQRGKGLQNSDKWAQVMLCLLVDTNKHVALTSSHPVIQPINLSTKENIQSTNQIYSESTQHTCYKQTSQPTNLLTNQTVQTQPMNRSNQRTNQPCNTITNQSTNLSTSTLNK